jgi:hypothetical protein
MAVAVLVATVMTAIVAAVVFVIVLAVVVPVIAVATPATVVPVPVAMMPVALAGTMHEGARRAAVVGALDLSGLGALRGRGERRGRSRG